MDDELAWMSATELRARIATGEVSPVEVTEACLARIEALEPELHAFITVAADRALADARAAADAVAAGRPLGPLHGVPVALKDEAWTEGIASTGGSRLFQRFVPRRDGTVSERLRAAGAVVVGKTNLPELAAWPRSKNPLVPESVNPWDPSRISGASSGGSAAAVATGMVPLAIGSDGGGSIRIPSALCGTVGLYPTPGRVPSYGSFSYSPAGSLGPMARTVEDLALAFGVLAGPDPRDAAALREAPPDVWGALGWGVHGLRVAWSPDFGRIPVEPGVRAAAEAGVARLAQLGAAVDVLDERIEHPWGDAEAMAAFQAAVAAWPSEASTGAAGAGPEPPALEAEEGWMWEVFAHEVPFTATERFRDLARRHKELLSPHWQLSLEAQDRFGPEEATVRRLADLSAQLHRLLDRYDVLCSPTMAVVAPPAPDGWATPYPDAYMGTNFTFVANAVGCPAASVPCGLADGLPVGLQVIGRLGDEPTVLQVCHAFQVTGPQLPRPPLAAST